MLQLNKMYPELDFSDPEVVLGKLFSKSAGDEEEDLTWLNQVWLIQYPRKGYCKTHTDFGPEDVVKWPALKYMVSVSIVLVAGSQVLSVRAPGGTPPDDVDGKAGSFAVFPPFWEHSVVVRQKQRAATRPSSLRVSMALHLVVQVSFAFTQNRTHFALCM